MESQTEKILIQLGPDLFRVFCATGEVIQNKQGSHIDFDKLGDYIKKRREDSGTSQRTLAYKAGISINVLRKIESGSLEVGLDKLQAVLFCYGISLSVSIG